MWRGSWYASGSCSGTTNNPSPPWAVNISVNERDVTISFAKGEGASITEIDYYWLSNWPDSSTSGSSFSITVPDYDTSYQFDMRSVGSNGSTSSWTSTFSFTSGRPQPPTTPGGPYLTGVGSGRTDAALNLDWGSSTNADSYILRYKNYDGVYHYIYGIHPPYNLTGLQYGVTYYVSVKAVNSVGESGYSAENAATTRPRTPTISQGTVTSTSVEIQIGDMSGNFDRITVRKQNTNGSLIGSEDAYTSNTSVIFTGLVPGSTYHFKASSFFTINGTTLESYYYSNTLEITVGARPDNWAWSFDIYQGGDVYNTVVQADGTIWVYIMPSTEWNNFIDRILKFLVYMGKTPGPYTYATTDSNCTADIINEAADLINQMGFAIQHVSDEVPASIFIQMRDCLNSIT
jgi:hypothetical protein